MAPGMGRVAVLLVVVLVISCSFLQVSARPLQAGNEFGQEKFKGKGWPSHTHTHGKPKLPALPSLPPKPSFTLPSFTLPSCPPKPDSPDSPDSPDYVTPPAPVYDSPPYSSSPSWSPPSPTWSPPSPTWSPPSPTWSPSPVYKSPPAGGY